LFFQFNILAKIPVELLATMCSFLTTPIEQIKNIKYITISGAA
jgi:hypothetical protein